MKKFEKEWKKAAGSSENNPNSINWDELDRRRKAFIVERPPGCFTTKEYATRHSLSFSRASHQIVKLEKLGQIKRVSVLGKLYWQLT